MAGFGLNLKLVLYLQSQCLTESLGFLNPPLLQAAKRCVLFNSCVCNSTARIAVRNLEFWYGANRALKGIDLECRKNETTVIIGGLISSTLLDFFVHPALFWLFGRKDAERMGLQGRKERYGLFAISQYVEHFEGIGIQNLPMRVITPFKPTDRDYARDSFRRLGINPDEYPEVLDTRVQPGRGLAYLFDDLGRVGLVDMLAPVQQELVDAFDTRDLQDQGWAA